MSAIEYKDPNWWNYLICACGMSAGLYGVESGFGIAIVSALMIVVRTVLVWRKDKRNFPLQVRLSYTLLLIAAWFDPLRALYWLPAVGTWFFVLLGYCTVARGLSLIPAVSGQAFSFARARQIIFARPVRNILQAV